jgi:hypothetical protein
MNARNSLRFFALLAATLVSACGGGGHTASVHPLAPGIAYPQTSGFVVGAGITPLVPVTSGGLSGFTVEPPLPAGMMIAESTGAIFGTPTAVAPTTTYTVQAMSADGRVAGTVTFTVREVVPQISYAITSWDLVQNVPSQCIAPTVRGGAVGTWSIDRPLPPGLLFDLSNGQICGTPTEASPRTNYIVTGTNSTGSSSATLAIAVQAMSSTGGAALQIGKRALSLDSTGHGVLWNAGTGTSLRTFDDVVDSYGRVTCALGKAHCLEFLGLAANTAVVWSDTRLIVLDSASGALRSQIQVAAPIRWWRLAVDGSYVAAATGEQLTVWAPTGEVLFSKAGYYGDAIAFAAVSELRIGAGAAGTHVIETITVPSGIATVSVPYLGSFRSWSEDGEKFLTVTGDSGWIYSRDATQIAFAPGEPGVVWPDPGQALSGRAKNSGQ